VDTPRPTPTPTPKPTAPPEGGGGPLGAPLNFSNPPIASAESFLRRSGFGPLRHIFSSCWCWDRTANRFTCTGMGTTILVPLVLPFRPNPWEVSPAFTLFHLARRFWNQIFTYSMGFIVSLGLSFLFRRT